MKTSTVENVMVTPIVIARVVGFAASATILGAIGAIVLGVKHLWNKVSPSDVFEGMSIEELQYARYHIQKLIWRKQLSLGQTISQDQIESDLKNLGLNSPRGTDANT